MSETTTKSPLLAIAMAFACYFGFNLTDAGQKLLTARYSPLELAFFTGICCSLWILLWLGLRGKLGRIVPKCWKLSLGRAALMTVANFACLYGLGNLPLTDFYAIVFTTPLLTTLLAWLVIGDKITFNRMAAILVGFIGVLIVAQPGSAAFSLGGLAVLFLALALAVSAVLVRLAQGQESVWVFAFTQYCFYILGTLPVAALPFFETLSASDTMLQDIGLFVATSGSGVLSTLLLVQATKITPSVSIIAPIHYSQLITGALLGWLIFGDIPTSSTITGAILIVAAGLIVILGERKAETVKTPVTSPQEIASAE